jgi:hypothetical protein
LPIEFHFSVFLFFYCAEFRRATQKKRSSAAKYLNHFIRQSFYTTDRPSTKICFASNSGGFIGYEAFGVSVTLDACVADSAERYP